MLLPALHKAREITKHTVCKSNKKSHYALIFDFGNNNNGKYPNLHPSGPNVADVAEDKGTWYGANIEYGATPPFEF